MAAALRATVNDDTRHSANYLMMLRETNTPVDFIFGAPPREAVTQQPTDASAYSLEARQRLQQAYALIRERMSKRQGWNKRRHDRRLQEELYEPGDAVFFLNMSPPSTKIGAPKTTKKLMPLWKGPGLVT